MTRQDSVFTIPPSTIVQRTVTYSLISYGGWASCLRTLQQSLKLTTIGIAGGLGGARFLYTPTYITPPPRYITACCWYLICLFSCLKLCVFLCVPQLVCGIGAVLLLSEWWMKGGGSWSPIRAESRWTICRSSHAQTALSWQSTAWREPHDAQLHCFFSFYKQRLHKTVPEMLLHELLLSVWSLSECSSCRILSMVCFLSWSSWSLVSLTLAAVAPVSRPVWGPEAEWRRGLCWGGPTAWGDLDQHTSLERERLSAWRRLSGTALVCMV